mgnify:CR=1 FL=1
MKIKFHILFAESELQKFAISIFLIFDNLNTKNCKNKTHICGFLKNYEDVFWVSMSQIFSVRESFLIWHSRFRASLSVSKTSKYRKQTGVRPRVYFAHFFSLCVSILFSKLLVKPVYRVLSEHSRIYVKNFILQKFSIIFYLQKIAIITQSTNQFLLFKFSSEFHLFLWNNYFREILDEQKRVMGVLFWG